MYYAALLTITDPVKNAEVRPAHLDYLNGLFLEGKIFASGPFADGKGGMVIYKAETQEEAQSLAENDPVIVAGCRTLELREWKMLDLPLK